MRRSSGKRWVAARWAVAASIAAVPAAAVVQASRAAEPDQVKIAVFGFELDDRSAAGGTIGPDAIDAENLKKATEEARQRLAASGRYTIVDTGAVAGQSMPAGGIFGCNGCEAALAGKLGAEQSIYGVFARVSRTEYTLQIVVRDAQTGAILSNAFSGLRMGANYAWPRAVASMLDNKILQ
jgi:Protein of unknown function (DUF2380)